MVRYADDFIVCFQYERKARGFREALNKRLSKFGLKIYDGKSRIIEFGRYAWQRAQREDVFLKSRVRENLKHGSVGGIKTIKGG